VFDNLHLLVQAGATVAAAQRRHLPALIGSTLLGMSATVGGISGFFDASWPGRTSGLWAVRPTPVSDRAH
jgi:hypothetical protein